MVGLDSTARLIDAFVDSLVLELSRLRHAGNNIGSIWDVISDIEIKEVRRGMGEETGIEEAGRFIYGTQEEMLAMAKEGYFVRDAERNLLYCPNGEILRRK